MMNKPLYIFDMDETLINADYAMIWNEFMVDKGLFESADFLQEDQRLMTLYARGELDMEDYLTFSLSPLKNIPTNKVAELVKECIDTRILTKQFSQSKTLINTLTQNNVDMVIISASVTFLVKVIGEKIGIKHALGIDLVEHNGCYTSEIKGVPSYREGKVTRLKAWLKTQSNIYSEIHFYTDSINDLPLCQFADFSYLVNPCPRLKAYATQTNWQVLSWC